MTRTHKAWRLHAYNDLRFEDVAGGRDLEAAALMQGLDLTAVVP